MEKKKKTNKNTIVKKSTSGVKKVTVKKKSKKKRSKAFTLIELLAVIIILGVLMIIAIPSITSYINDSRKSSYISTAKNIVIGARNFVNQGTLGMFDTSATYYLPYKMIKTENDAKSPYGDLEEGYVVVTYDGKGYDYYFTSIDKSKVGMYLTYYDKLDTDRIVTDMKEITTDIGICDKENIVVFSEDGRVVETKEADDCIIPQSVYDGGDDSNQTYIASNEGYFYFDKEVGAIVGVHDLIEFEVLDYNQCATYFTEEGFTYSEAMDFCQNGLVEEITGGYDVGFARDLVRDGIIRITKTESYPADLVIPEKISGKKVTSIASYAFVNEDKRIERITIPKTITSIGNHAFCHYTDNCTLYNIVNKSGKSFNWDLNDEAYYEEDVIDNTLKYGAVQVGFAETITTVIRVTEEPLEIDLNSIFDINYNTHTVKLINNSGYDVFYFTNGLINSKTPFELNSTKDIHCNFYARLEKNGEVYYQREIAFDINTCK